MLKKTPSQSILFVCLGNICRSPMAEAVFCKMLSERDLTASFVVDSAGTAGYHTGQQPDMRMQQMARARGYVLNHRARQVCTDDFDRFDLILGMDDNNVDDLLALAPTPEAMRKIHRMTDFCQHIEADHVPDPYYGGTAGFHRVVDLLEDACSGLLDSLLNTQPHIKNKKNG